MDNVYDNCLYHSFYLKDIEIRTLENNIKLLLSPNETKIVKTCGQQNDNQIIKGTYLINNTNNCLFTINDKIIRNYKMSINSKIKFIDYQEKHEQITTINLTQPNLFKLSEKIIQQEQLIKTINISQHPLLTTHYVLYSVGILLIFILLFVMYRQRQARRLQCKQPIEVVIPMQELPPHL